MIATKSGATKPVGAVAERGQGLLARVSRAYLRSERRLMRCASRSAPSRSSNLVWRANHRNPVSTAAQLSIDLKRLSQS